jgi:excisionase family DNA binding protein
MMSRARKSPLVKSLAPNGNLPRSHSSDTRLLTVAQAAELCQLSERQMRRMIRDGTIRALRFGRSVRIRPTDLGI